MKLNSLSVRNYRNLSDTSFVLKGESVGLVGENGQGKTNLLEAIYMLATGDTWRGDEDADVIRFGESYSRVEGEVYNEEAVRLALFMEKSVESNRLKKQYLVNEISRKKETFTSECAVVLFHPEDIQIVNGSPSSRRSLMDQCISEVFPYYRRLVSQYGRVLTARNRILDGLREGTARENQLEYWTESMVRLGCEIYEYRYKFFRYIQSQLHEFYVEYKPHIACDYGDVESSFVEVISKIYTDRVKANFRKEVISATSQYGPHKDDYGFLMNEKDIGRYGSRGEQRAALFAFKKAHVHYLEMQRNIKPILLLDDIFSEFDAKHRNSLVELCRGYQTFVTGTEEQFFNKEEFTFDQLYKVSEGSVVLIS